MKKREKEPRNIVFDNSDLLLIKPNKLKALKHSGIAIMVYGEIFWGENGR